MPTIYPKEQKWRFRICLIPQRKPSYPPHILSLERTPGLNLVFGFYSLPHIKCRLAHIHHSLTDSRMPQCSHSNAGLTDAKMCHVTYLLLELRSGRTVCNVQGYRLHKKHYPVFHLPHIHQFMVGDHQNGPVLEQLIVSMIIHRSQDYSPQELFKSSLQKNLIKQDSAVRSNEE